MVGSPSLFMTIWIIERYWFLKKKTFLPKRKSLEEQKNPALLFAAIIHFCKDCTICQLLIKGKTSARAWITIQIIWRKIAALPSLINITTRSALISSPWQYLSNFQLKFTEYHCNIRLKQFKISFEVFYEVIIGRGGTCIWKHSAAPVLCLQKEGCN